MQLHIYYFLPLQTRVTNTAIGERNFHIFYQLLLGGDIQLLSTFHFKLFKKEKKHKRK